MRWTAGASWQNGAMPMRQDCKNFESRTYPGGETVRKCDLDLAPEAPWRCPDACPAYEPRLADVNWAHGTLVTPPTPAEPPGLEQDDRRRRCSTRRRTSSTPPRRPRAEVDEPRTRRWRWEAVVPLLRRKK